MKVLLIGEFSGLHKYLNEGLQEIGIETRYIANGDGWKKIGSADDALFTATGKTIASKINGYVINAYKRANALQGFDIVQLMHQDLYWPIVNDFMVKRLLYGSGKSFLLSAGYDTHIISQMR